MATETAQKYCPACERNTMAQRPGTNHILHLLLTICTGGLWLIIWILASIRIGGWKCSTCGSSCTAVRYDANPKSQPKARNIRATVEAGEDDLLEMWAAAPNKSLTSSRDPQVNYLIKMKGTQRTIRYYGKYHKVLVKDVFRKEGYDHPYLDAMCYEDGTRKTYNFEHIEIPGDKWRKPEQLEQVDTHIGELLACPQCSEVISIPADTTDVTCPSCKAELEFT